MLDPLVLSFACNVPKPRCRIMYRQRKSITQESSTGSKQSIFPLSHAIRTPHHHTAIRIPSPHPSFPRCHPHPPSISYTFHHPSASKANAPKATNIINIKQTPRYADPAG
ncbi:hypothetical protein BT67DRAFT_19860 [Trichocladium antarcticum]|uniref:Uncharacterized protein n=1 Tax=Trichocladium antarcticum TaxID=1450529 RepID=A0AAN6UVQ0_9PEZI|nr:hypothetical protein BT67DRAFT_19860 [Trichocladium antarcticum]